MLDTSAPERAQQQPAYATVDDWKLISGMRRTATFAAISEGRLRAVRFGRRTLIDVQAGLRYMDSLPQITPRQAA